MERRSWCFRLLAGVVTQRNCGRYTKIVIVLVLMTIVIIIILYTKSDERHFGQTGHMVTARDYVLGEEELSVMSDLPKRQLHIHRNKLDVFKTRTSNGINIKGDSVLLTLKTFSGKMPIYVHPPSIDIVSSYIQDHGTWEEALLNQTGKYLLHHPGTTFIDIGCNIGVYTLFVAKLGVHVIAIDPIDANIRLLAMSVREGGLHDNVTVIRNAVSNVYTQLLVDVPVDNIGGAHIIGDANQVRQTKTTTAVDTVLLDDLVNITKTEKVFLKMDVEGHEFQVIQGGETFFQRKDVQCILMEWVHHKSTTTGQQIIDFMLRKGYLPYEHLESERLHPDSYYRWPENVFWLKR